MFKRKRAAYRAAAALVGAAGLLLAGFSAPAAQAAGWNGCSGYTIIPFNDGSWSKALTTPSGHVVGYTKNATNSPCSHQWYEHMLVTDKNYRFEMDIWGPQSTKYWPGPWTNAWQNTAYLRSGGTYCAGAHIYDRNGRWLKWQFLGCFNT